MQLTEAKLFEFLGRLYATKELLLQQAQAIATELEGAKKDVEHLQQAMNDAKADHAPEQQAKG